MASERLENMASPWIYRPWLDLTVGCGAWAAPLLLPVYFLAPPEAQTWAVAFYALALVFNYPHFMATIYRAYGTKEDFSKYHVLTVHVTMFLVLTAVFAHASFPLARWIFIVYITWSPWHYTGQHYGLLMMFARRNGAAPTSAERRTLYLAFVASYAMLLLSFHSGPSSDRFMISLGLPESLALVGQALLGIASVALGGFALVRLVRQMGLRAMAAPLTLFATQILWFVLPTVIQQGYGLQIPQSRYSTGILAVMHSTQHLWITRLDRLDTSLELYGTAITIARQTSERRLKGFAHSRMVDFHDRLGDLVPAARAYQRGLALDAAAEDARGESLDWFNYGRFLQRHGLPARLAYACFLRSEALFDSAPGGQLDTVTKARAQTEVMLGDDAAKVRRDLPSVLNEALGLTDVDFVFASSR